MQADIITACHLTSERLQSERGRLQKHNYNPEEIGLDDSNVNDYIIVDLTLDGKQYTLIHGEPVDNPNGVIYNDQELHRVGEIRDDSEELSDIQKWYQQITEGASRYQEWWWDPYPLSEATKELIEERMLELSQDPEKFNERMQNLFHPDDPIGCTCFECNIKEKED